MAFISHFASIMAKCVGIIFTHNVNSTMYMSSKTVILSPLDLVMILQSSILTF